MCDSYIIYDREPHSPGDREDKCNDRPKFYKPRTRGELFLAQRPQRRKPVSYPDGVLALVTGGASGIGAATAARLRADNVRVVTADLAPGADERLDITDPDAVAALVAELGTVGILVHSAGIVGPSQPLAELDLDEWRTTFRVNVDGTFLMCRAVIAGMVAAGWGRIVTMASIAGKDGNPAQSAYSASKAAVIAMTKSLGKELATTGVLVNAVAPSAVATAMNAATDPAILVRSQSLTPMGRFGRPDEIAELIAWLCSEQLSYSTGAVYDASGGRATY